MLLDSCRTADSAIVVLPFVCVFLVEGLSCLSRIASFSSLYVNVDTIFY